MADTCRYGNPMYVPPDPRGERLNLYLLTQSDNIYDTYDSCVVAAKTEQEAAETHPTGDSTAWAWSLSWAVSPAKVSVQLIGQAALGTEPGVILSSYNAG